jgi:capsular polysaccharide biosynthesis protein
LLFAGAAGLTAGLMLAALIMVLLTVRDTSIRTLAEVRELTGLTAVGSIRRIGQAG